MAPKTKRTQATKKKPSARKRPSQTNLLSIDAAASKNKKNERSVMVSIDQEPSQEPTANRKTTMTAPMPPAPPMISKQPAAPKENQKTVMMAPTLPHPPAQPPAPPVPTPPVMLQPQTPIRQPPEVIMQNPAPMASPNPVISNGDGQMGQMGPPRDVPPRMEMTTPVNRRMLSREVSVDDGEGGSARLKRNDIITAWLNMVLQNGVEGLRKEYRDSPNEAPMDRAVAFADNPTRNRYNNIPCCDATRIMLPDDPHFYIHANVVSTNQRPRRFVCTQAPLASTIEDFWKMIIVSGIEYIVMLCEIVEQGKTKSAVYFPTKLGESMKIGRLCNITRESCVEIEKNISVATLRISKVSDSAVAMTVKHIHWHQWPDHGVPDDLNNPFRLMSVLKSSTKPIVIHCSAGVGRTGTLALILITLESLRAPNFLGVPRLMAKLREERFKSIQTEMQYLYVHRCIIEYLVLKKYPYNKETYAKFVKDYAAATDVGAAAAAGADKPQ